MNQIQNLIPPLVYKNTSAAEWVEKTKTIIKMISGRLSQISVYKLLTINSKRMRVRSINRVPTPYIQIGLN